MRKLTLFIALFLTVVCYSQETKTQLNWLTNLEEAQKKSVKEKKPILMFFTGSDWCSPCKMLKKDFFNSDKFEEKSKNLILVMVDMPRRIDIISESQRAVNKKLVKKYNKDGSYPTLVALNGKGKVLGELSGYTFLRETDRHYSFVDKIIEKF